MCIVFDVFVVVRCVVEIEGWSVSDFVVDVVCYVVEWIIEDM